MDTTDFITLTLKSESVRREVDLVERIRIGNEVHDGLQHRTFQGGYVVNVNEHDIAVLVLSAPVKLERYPLRSRDRERQGTPIFGVGWIAPSQQGKTLAYPLVHFHDQHVWNIRVSVSTTQFGNFLQAKDSGGPWITADGARIVGLSRGANPSVIYSLANAKCWLAERIQTYGGEGPQGDQGYVPTSAYYCN